MNAAVYLRVSSKDGRQDEANQEPACAQLCAARGWTITWFTERESAARDRPEWRHLMGRARKGEFRAVVFWALDRIGRNRVQVAHDLGELSRWGVHLASVQDAWIDQPAGPLRDLLVQILGWVAEGERARLIERTKAGQARARLAGKVIGRPRADRGKLDRAAHLVTMGKSIRQAAAVAGVARATLRAHLAKTGSVIEASKPAVSRAG